MQLQKSDSFKRWLLKVSKYKPLGVDEERELFKKANRGSISARNKIIEHYILFIVMVAHRYASMYVPMEDMIGDGVMGMIEAIPRFKYKKKGRFSSYAYHWVRSFILRDSMAFGRLIRLPCWVTDNYKRFFDAIRCGGDINIDDVARKMKLKNSSSLLALLSKSISIDDNNEILNSCALSCDFLTSDDISKFFNVLNKQERDIIMRRFGFYGGERERLRQISKKYKLSYERIRQIEVSAIEKLRKKLKKDIALSL